MPDAPKKFQPHGVRAANKTEARPNSHQRGYTRQWSKARTGFLAKHPLCVTCQENGRIKAATVVDHIIPHKGDKERFWNRANWQSLCALCHNRKSATE
jgi:5-methylcytosine-specific restriction protein A